MWECVCRGFYTLEVSCCTSDGTGYNAEYVMAIEIEVIPGDFVPRQSRQGLWADGRLDGPLVLKEAKTDDNTICTPPCTPVPGTLFSFALQVCATENSEHDHDSH